MKKTLALLLPLAILASTASCAEQNTKTSESDSAIESEIEIASDSTAKDHGPRYQRFASMTPEEIAGELTLEQKASQMVQPAVYNITEDDMKANDYGSILSTVGCIDSDAWAETVDGFQQAAIESEAGIPYIYGQDDVHGVNYCRDAVYFPHNIGQGAANDEELAYQVGLITADEAKLCHMLWNFSPCVAQSVDPRWGRTYESYGSDLETITKLSTAYTKGLQDGGLVACAKHFFADGNVLYGTGEEGAPLKRIDRGDAQLTDAEIEELLKVYQAQIDAGVQTIMISHSALNGVKMHENKDYIMKLKNEMGFDGFIVSDWGSIQHISGDSYKDQVITSINAGIDMLMETDRYAEAKQIIVDAVGSGEITEERVNDAVTRIIKVKKEAGIFDDPLCENLQTKQKETGSLEYRKVAEKLVEESLVLLKNENNVLPLKKGTKVYITGPAANSCQAQCGGWTMDWNGSTSKDVPGVTTIQEAFERYAEDYGIEVITDKEEADKADVVLLCLGEQNYAEWNGDTEDMSLFGTLGLKGNKEARAEAKALGKPTVTCIVAGRNVLINKRVYDDWDSVVMCYLPGSEGKGISDVLCGCSDFTGKLPSPWYSSLNQIRTDNCWLERGYGLNYGDGFKAQTEPETILDPPTEVEPDPAIAGTNYTPGLFKDGVYVNDYAKIKINVPGNLNYFPYTLEEKEEDIAALTDEEDIIRETSRTIDGVFANAKETVDVIYVNTKLAFPDAENVTVEMILDDYKAWIEKFFISDDSEYDWKERTKVKLGAEEFTRDLVFYDETCFDAIYMKKLDDDLMCWVYVSTCLPERTPEYYESLFEDIK
ncbi:glycoside hydrolase family 3 protein [Ruminococcus sp.]|uniref:glycoside hydrolase family 3 protein n=1 Tax=Ruminococcus sp. TaxID=41978 RepID=UPI0025D07DAB|nr:glycoside hydrolase family 3 protein [Ruminococcus sp.]MCR4639058.1 glycoside hydrolase family 3 protein [Ruminococcus sp.]